jgi:GGDEF domain-containing protein
VLCLGVDDADVATTLAARIVAQVRVTAPGGPEVTAPDPLGSLVVSASVGVALLRPGDDPDEVVHHADGALYAAKRAGRSAWRLAETP